MLVWNEMPSITPMMSVMRLDDVVTSCIVVTTLLTTSPPFCAVAEAVPASWLACLACSAFWRTVVVNSSSVEAVSSSELACSSVRLESCWLPAATWPAPTAIDSAPVRICATMRPRPSFISRSAASSSAASSRPATLDARGEVARGHAARDADRFAQRPGDAARGGPGDQHREQQHDRLDDVDGGGEAVAAHDRGLRRFLVRLLLQVDQPVQLEERLLDVRIDLVHEDLGRLLVAEARGKAERLLEGLVELLVGLVQGLEDLALLGRERHARHLLARLVVHLAEPARAVLVDLHRLDVGVQADVAHHRRLLEGERLHLGGEGLLGAGGGDHRGEVVAALLAEPGAGDGHRQHDGEDRAEAQREARADSEVA